MANWRKGFFRLWVLLTVLWLVIVGLIASGSILNPYISNTLFTFNKDNKLEIVPLYSDKYTKMLSEESAGYYTRVGFKEDAPDVYYMAPNAFQVTVRGKKFEALLSNERLNDPDHEELVTALLGFIDENKLNLDPPVSAEEVRAAIPDVIELQYKTPEVGEQTRQFAIATQSRAMEEARRNNLTLTAAVMFIPPIVVLVLGAALGWVLTGFRRQRAADP